jgi:hypothetical protein
MYKLSDRKPVDNQRCLVFHEPEQAWVFSYWFGGIWLNVRGQVNYWMPEPPAPEMVTDIIIDSENIERSIWRV